MVGYFPGEKLLKGPAPGGLVLTLAPIVQATPRLCLDLLSWVEERRFVSLRVSHYVRLSALSSLLGLHGAPVLSLIVMHLFGIETHIVLH